MAQIYFRVIGIVIENGEEAQYRLGFTSSPKAWARNSNGWKLEDLRFIPMMGQRKEKKDKKAQTSA